VRPVHKLAIPPDTPSLSSELVASMVLRQCMNVSYPVARGGPAGFPTTNPVMAGDASSHISLDA
jgi:hypothetical protein